MKKVLALILTPLLCTSLAFADCGSCGSEGADHHHGHDHAAHAEAKGTIVDTAVANKDFSILVELLTTAGLVDTLKGEGPFTVFAPTNDAFAKVPAATLAELKADKEKLTKVLTYHVVAGKVGSDKVVTLTSAKTLEGSEAKVTVKDGTVTIDQATVTNTDIDTTNGVIHVIDSVLMPKG